MSNIEPKIIIRALIKKGHTVYENDKKNYNLNIVGVRASNPIPNKWNDKMFVLWKYEGAWNKLQMQCTTLAGINWLENPLNPKGCAILVPGQYKGVWKIDKHRGMYDALCQKLGDVKVYRDDDEDKEYDLIETSIQKGMFGINIHRGSAQKEVENVNKYSAGCQVIQDPLDYNLFMYICKLASMVWKNKFTYTLLKEDDL